MFVSENIVVESGTLYKVQFKQTPSTELLFSCKLRHLLKLLAYKNATALRTLYIYSFHYSTIQKQGYVILIT
jgi:hypothetical protein